MPMMMAMVDCKGRLAVVCLRTVKQFLCAGVEMSVFVPVVAVAMTIRFGGLARSALAMMMMMMMLTHDDVPFQ
jgi:hypothetical protein